MDKCEYVVARVEARAELCCLKMLHPLFHGTTDGDDSRGENQMPFDSSYQSYPWSDSVTRPKRSPGL